MKQTKLDINKTIIGKQITVAGVTVGNYSAGDVINADDSLVEVLEKIFTKEIFASYSSPSGSISSTVSGNVEIGSTLSPVISASFNRNDAGALTKYVLKRGSDILVDSATISPFTDSITATATAISYSATFSYSAGAIKNTNLGNPSPSGAITAGSVNSGTISITGRRNAFYGVNNSADSSAVIRTLTPLLNPSNGTSFTIEIPANATSVIFAYPDNLREVTSVVHVETNYQVKSTFLLTTVNVSGANNYSYTPYKVYRYTPTGAFSSPQKYTVMI